MIQGNEKDFITLKFDNQAPLSGVLSCTVGYIEPYTVTSVNKGIPCTVRNPKAGACDNITVQISKVRNPQLVAVLKSFCGIGGKEAQLSYCKTITLQGGFAIFDGSTKTNRYVTVVPGSFSFREIGELTPTPGENEENLSTFFEIKGNYVVDYDL